jgi:3-oxoacyl-[acyl-carrier-protein] synthase-3
VKFHRTFIAGVGYTLPDEVVTTAELEARLYPLYERLGLPEGRLEQMSGIRERRFWPVGTPLAPISATSGRKAMEQAGIEPAQIGVLVHGSVCRDFLEPATACRVHHELGLAPDCLIYDVSNACLGILNGMVQVAAMIELGQIRAGLVVGTENGSELVENTVRLLNSNVNLTRRTIKSSIASLTIGSASVAVLLCSENVGQASSLSSSARQASNLSSSVRRAFSPSASVRQAFSPSAPLRKAGSLSQNRRGRLLAATARARTSHHTLCQSDGLETIMQTDSEELMRWGVATGAETFACFLREVGWRADEINRTFCHQVGVAHRKLLFEKLGLDPRIDFPTLEWLGNTGAAALPVTMAIGLEQGQVQPGDRVALLGIGSGINCLMLAAQW